MAFWPTDLSKLLKPNMGRVHWAACQNVTHTAPWAAPAVRVFALGSAGFAGYVGYQFYDLHHLHAEMDHLDQKLNETDPASPDYGDIMQKYWEAQRKYYDKRLFGVQVNR